MSFPVGWDRRHISTLRFVDHELERAYQDADQAHGVRRARTASLLAAVVWMLVALIGPPAIGISAANGNGIYTDQGTQDVLVSQNTFRRNMNSAVLFTNVSPTVNSNITVRRNSAVNNASFVLLFGRNDNVTISGNHTNDTNASDNANQGTAIRIDGDANGVQIRRNTILRSPFSGVAVRNGAAEDTTGPVGVEIAFNTVRFAANDGIDVTSTVAGSVDAHGNTIRGSRNDGIFFDVGTSGDTIASNSALSSKVWDCQDLSTGTGTAGTANTWTHDIGVKDSPNGLCRNPS